MAGDLVWFGPSLDEVLGDVGVECPAGLEQDRVVGGLLDERVPELVHPGRDPPLLDEQIPSHQVSERGIEVGGLGEVCQLFELEFSTEHRCELEDLACALLETIEPGIEEAGDGAGDGRRRILVDQGPPPVQPRERSRLHHLAEDLLHEERVPVGSLVDQGVEWLGHVLGVEDLRHHVASGRLVEGGEADRGVPVREVAGGGLVESPRRIVPIRTHEADDGQHRSVGRLHQFLEQCERDGVGPVEVLDHQHARRRCRTRLDVVDDGREHLALQGRRFHVADQGGHVRFGIDAQHHGEERGSVAGLGHHGLDGGGDLRSARLGIVVLVDLEEPGEQIDEGRIRDGRVVGEALRLCPSDVGGGRLLCRPPGEAPLGLEIGLQGTCELRLPDACLADDRADLALSGSDALDHPTQLRQLRDPSDEARLPTEHCLVRRLRSDRQHSIGGDGLGLPLRRHRLDGLDVEEPFDEPMGGPGDLQCAGCCGLFHAGCDVHRVSQRGVLDPEIRSHLADDHEPGVDPHSEVELHSPALLDLSGVRLGGSQHLEAGHDGPLRIVLVGDGSAEEGEYGVAHQTCERSLVAVDGTDEPLERPVDDVCPVLRVELLGGSRRPLHVGEQHRDRPPFAGHRLAGPRRLELLLQTRRQVSRQGIRWLGGVGGVEARAAVGTERVPLPIGGRARRAGEREGSPAVRAEGSPLRVRMATCVACHGMPPSCWNHTDRALAGAV